MGINQKDARIIKSLIPLIEKADSSIPQRMFEILFSEYPEIKPMFEDVKIVEQHSKLANMIVEYANNIDSPEKLLEPIEKIAQSHVNHAVKREHYSIVGKCLLKAIVEVTGCDPESDIIEAWGRAFMTLAEILMGREEELYGKDDLYDDDDDDDLFAAEEGAV